MNLEELARTLPNGFHDAQLRRFAMDYVTRTLELELELWIGDMDDAARREAYRAGRLTLTGVAYLVIEPPGKGGPWLRGKSLCIDAGPGVPERGSYPVPDQPEDTFQAWLFLGDLNTFLHVAAAHAVLEWTGEERIHPTGSSQT